MGDMIELFKIVHGCIAWTQLPHWSLVMRAELGVITLSQKQLEADIIYTNIISAPELLIYGIVYHTIP